ncbi:MAG: hypothetical protein QOI06_2284 [Nocardioidaceae bacterium]|jgi:hypothetical protein|nr:hypothetical protein [Nocardioidaceae bacterium]
MTLRVRGDAKKLEELAAKHPEVPKGISDRGREAGAISHHFYGNDDEILVVDEWPDEETFRGFFDASPEIAGLMQEVGVTSQPEITFWRKLETHDDIG